MSRCGTFLLVISFGFLLIQPAFGINIILESLTNTTHPKILDGTFNFSEEPPTFDSDSSDLLTILQHTESVYQDAFEDTQTIRITYLWDLASPFSGQAPPSLVFEDGGGQLTHAVVRFDPLRNWYVDPTPANDSEFDMAQVLYSYGSNTLSSTERLANFSGTVPDVFEAGYNGLADPTGPAAPDGGGNQLDLLTVAFQEVGHTLGLSSGFPGNIVTDAMGNPVSGEAADSDWDVDPDFVRGAVMAIRAPGVGSNGPFAHMVGSDAVMAVSLSSNERTRPSAADFFGIAATQGWTTIDLPRQDFLGGSNWHTPGNWTGNQVPLGADDAYVRSALNGSTLTASLSANGFASNLSVENGSNVDTNSFKLDIGGDVTVTGLDSDIFINASGELEADEIFIQDQSEIQMTGGLVDARRLVIDEGTQLEGVSGGTMTIDISQGLVNNGVIDVDGGAVMTFVSAGATPWDLDGTSGDGELFANGGNLIFDTGGLSDSFNGEMNVDGGFFLRIDAGWTFASGAVLDMNGGSGGGNSARIVGGTVTITGGTVDVDDVGGDGLTDGKAEFDAPVVITGGTVSVGADDTLDFDNTTTVENGTFTLANNATINFDGTTTIETADFDFAGGGEVVFNGPTTHSFNTQITSNGLVRQDGDATIIGSMTVDGGTFDLDGTGGTSTISLGNVANNGSLTLNVDGIDSFGNTFDGTIETAEAGLIGRLTINLTNPADSWTMDGTLNLDGGNLLFQPVRVAGSKMVVTGTVNVSNSRVVISADTDFIGSSTINTASVSSELIMRGVTVVAAGADFNGLGTLVNDFGGDMTLADGLDTAFVDLDNKGTLRLGSSPGQVEVNGFAQTSGGVWEVEVGGSLASEFDSLSVDSTAELAGTLSLSLLNGFVPSVGKSFIILTAPFGVSGTFDTILGGVDDSIRLGVLYEPTQVRLFATFSADFDLDGDVDGDDLAQWEGDFGLNGQSDADGDGDSEGGDFLAWQRQFGSGLPTLAASSSKRPREVESSQAVPEPCTAVLLILGFLGYRWRRC